MSRDARVTRRGLPAAGVAAPSDRRYRRSDGVPVRKRRTIRTVWAVGRWMAGAVAVLLGGAWAVDRVSGADMFLVRDISVRGNTHLSTGEVETLLTGLRQENVFLADLEFYRQRLLDSPWVEQVALSRVLPSTVVLEVVERTPVALARLNEQLYLVDRSGNIIDEHRSEYRDFDLPIVDGLLVAGRREPAVADTDRAALMADVLDAFDAHAALAGRLSQIDLSRPRDVAVMLDDDPAWLHLGQAHFVDRLQRYLDLRPALVDRFGSIDYVDLKFDERVYVRGQGQRATGLAAK
jgi:cell division septal protein FtsQ